MTLGKGNTPPFKDAQGNVLPNSIASLETVNLGGVDQAILIRGTNRNNPVLLWLHGGPGFAEMRMRGWQSELEKHFVVVNWDQRGAGKSWTEGTDPQTLHFQQYFSDANELVALLQARFHTKKIYIAGHSWGSVIGTHLVKDHPENFYAYIGVGQGVDMYEGMKVSYHWALDYAKQAGNQQAIHELEQWGEPVPAEPIVMQKKWVHLLKWVTAFGGTEYHPSDTKALLMILTNPEYSLADWKKFTNGVAMTSNAKVIEEMWDVHLEEQIPAYQIPVYFFQGKHDYHTPYILVERYFENIKAPSKKLIPFENSAHDPFIEEQEKFDQVMLTTVLAETYK